MKRKKNAFYSFCRGLLYVPVKLIFPVKLIGKERLPLADKVVTVSNHLSLLDIALIGINVSGYRHILAKKELAENKLFGKLMDWAGAIPVDRGTADMSAMRKVYDALDKGEGITLFPEGTRNKNGEELQAVKSGAALFALHGKCDVVPIIILHKQRAFRRNYLYVAPAFSLNEYAIGGRVNGAAVASASGRIENEMLKARAYLEDYVSNKRWKEEKKAKKERKRLLKQYKKEAKLATKNLGRALKELR